MSALWEEGSSPFEEAFDAAAKQPPWYKTVHTHQRHPCREHTEPGPEMFKQEDGSEVEVTDALRAQWEQEGVTNVVRIRFVGTCHTNKCHEKGER